MYIDNLKKIKRTAKLVSILSKYGFETLVTQTGIKNLIPDSYIEANEKRKEVFSLTLYERIRMVLEELGPAYVKLGQLLSNRSDILPEELVCELQKLQDRVQSVDIDVYAFLKEELDIEPSAFFEDISEKPIAAASLSQVYTAILKENGQKVVLKIKRKGVRDIIEADILIIKDFAYLLEEYYDAARKINLLNIVRTFEQALYSELSFTLELSNMERFRRNFANDKTIYVPVTYKEFSNTNILCMEHVDGIKISDKEALINEGLELKDIAAKAVDCYMKQIIDHGFFHADPHSGNLFVLTDGRIVFLDFGMVGKMLPKDMDYLGRFVIHALQKDTQRLIKVIKRIAVKCSIPNENRFERELYDFLDIIHADTIKELDLADLVRRFNRMLNENSIMLPEYIYLLARGIILLEGIGLELGLDTNVIQNIEPYVKKLIRQRMDPRYIAKRVFNKLYAWGDRFEELPDDIHSLIQKMNNDEIKMTHTLNGMEGLKNSMNRLVVAMLASSLGVGSAILVLANVPPILFGVPIIGYFGFLFAGILAIILIIAVIRNK
ncbi:AarF/ABC1/UbiB kinase family protein [Dysgonomonas sp. 216]|uniref:ABC1 kinase family protein n=1 Tax=Dysgonomonas sp. 216 TaxID=2302934 RepID=UPI0013D324FA|nr:AarF/UbiB family protein [Dysgonomonas sp. 216]NDW17607.1 AarF/ABC1/UbiB kinase family protein [Dysgonomonas sp. 216]